MKRLLVMKEQQYKLKEQGKQIEDLQGGLAAKSTDEALDEMFSS